MKKGSHRGPFFICWVSGCRRGLQFDKLRKQFGRRRRPQGQNSVGAVLINLSGAVSLCFSKYRTLRYRSVSVRIDVQYACTDFFHCNPNSCVKITGLTSHFLDIISTNMGKFFEWDHVIDELVIYQQESKCKSQDCIHGVLEGDRCLTPKQ